MNRSLFSVSQSWSSSFPIGIDGKINRAVYAVYDVANRAGATAATLPALLAFIGVLLSATPAQANFDPVFLGTTAGVGGTTIFNYNLVFSPTNPSGGTDTLIAGNYLTFYDIGRVTVTPPANFTFTQALTGVTPSVFIPTFTDDASILNGTFTYTGPSVTTATTFAVSLVSTAVTTRSGGYTSQDFYTAPGGGTGASSTRGAVLLPNPASAVSTAGPEPGSLPLLGMGLISGLGVVGNGVTQRRRWKQTP